MLALRPNYNVGWAALCIFGLLIEFKITSPQMEADH